LIRPRSAGSWLIMLAQAPFISANPLRSRQPPDNQSLLTAERVRGRLLNSCA
jgi:hypothetical protein